LRLGSTPSWRNIKFAVVSFQFPAKQQRRVLAGFCSGRLLRRALLVPCLVTTAAAAQGTHQQPAKKVAAQRANELTLAGLRPGRARTKLAIQLLGPPARNPGPDYSNQLVWFDVCRDILLSIETDDENGIRVIRTAMWGGSTADCSKMPPGPWKTGHGLRIEDPTNKLLQLYGKPDSKSPSTRNGEPLELWYYAFDWAGPDVPQVMEVLCTTEKKGDPGRVIEITLAAPSL
jgi:hypothetical protein